ncbi:MAG: helix-turn-helix domain-containing protein, partial [Bacilli bacterium]|nr:helix-turn-helix domain-containing protein [Bacilli bacterium]
MDNKKIGNFIRELREKEGLSQGALAKKVFVASSVVSRWESGIAGVSASNLVLLSEIFHVSLDELVAGHKFDGNSKEEKDEVLIKVLNSHQKKSRYIKRLLHFIIVLLIVFLGYFFYNFYNSVKVYTIHMDTDKYNITYGMLTKTRDRIYFHLDVTSNANKDDIENISIYYNLGDDRKDVIKSNNLSSFNFIDYYGYEEYINFNNFDKIIDNMYFEVTYTDNSFENYKLNFERNYANIDFFLRKDRRINMGISEEDNAKAASDTIEKIEKTRAILKDNNGIMNIKYEGISYDVFLNDYGIKLYFFDDNFENSYIYSNQKYITFVYQKKINNDWDHLYSMN